MTVAWVLGGTGLLGSALSRQLLDRGVELFSPRERLRWESDSAIAAQLEAAVRDFATRASEEARWQIYWAAGIGTMNSIPEELTVESRVLAWLVKRIASTPVLTAIPGAVAFASSAGAIYAGCTDEVVTENSAPAPTTAYAYAKQEQERTLQSLASVAGNISVSIARISTIYGPGQAHGKRQGLLAHIARSIVRNRAIQIYVPLDTIRDYVAADDAAAMMVSAVSAWSGPTDSPLRIVASEQPTTIAEIISIFKRISRRAPLVVTAASGLGASYPPRIRFRSIATSANARPQRTCLAIGIARLLAAERSAYSRGE
jgi:UDP-glucose 4-epimerase